MNQIRRALIDLRKSIGESQEQFARRLKTTVRTVSRYETTRVPKGIVLSRLQAIATATGNEQCSAIFRNALAKELGLRNVVTIARRDRAEALRLLAVLHTQMQYTITSNTPPSTPDEDADLAEARKVQADAMELARRLRRAR